MNAAQRKLQEPLTEKELRTLLKLFKRFMKSKKKDETNTFSPEMVLIGGAVRQWIEWYMADERRIEL